MGMPLPKEWGRECSIKRILDFPFATNREPRLLFNERFPRRLTKGLKAGLSKLPYCDVSFIEGGDPISRCIGIDAIEHLNVFVWSYGSGINYGGGRTVVDGTAGANGDC